MSASLSEKKGINERGYDKESLLELVERNEDAKRWKDNDMTELARIFLGFNNMVRNVVTFKYVLSLIQELIEEDKLAEQELRVHSLRI